VCGPPCCWARSSSPFTPTPSGGGRGARGAPRDRHRAHRRGLPPVPDERAVFRCHSALLPVEQRLRTKQFCSLYVIGAVFIPRGPDWAAACHPPKSSACTTSIRASGVAILFADSSRTYMSKSTDCDWMAASGFIMREFGKTKERGFFAKLFGLQARRPWGCCPICSSCASCFSEPRRCASGAGAPCMEWLPRPKRRFCGTRHPGGPVWVRGAVDRSVFLDNLL